MGDKTKSKGNKKGSKAPEHEDFFTVFLAKKTRNMKKKLDKIAELEDRKKKGEELKKEQVESIQRKKETLDMIADNDRIKDIYLEAYSKKDENVPEGGEKVEEKVVEAPKPTEEETTNKTLEKSAAQMANLLVLGKFLKTPLMCEQLASKSNGAYTKASLEELSDNLDLVFGASNGNTWDKLSSSSDFTSNYFKAVPVMTLKNKSYAELSESVKTITSADWFCQFVPEVVPQKVEDIEANTLQVNNSTMRKESNQSKTKSRKESEAQQDVFMEEDDSDDDENKVENPAKVEKKTDAKVEEKPQQGDKSQTQNNQRGDGAKGNYNRNRNRNNNQKDGEKLTRGDGKGGVRPTQNKAEEKPKKEGEEDDDDFITVQRGPRPEGGQTRGRGQRGNYRGDRGGRGRGGRGGARNFDGEKKEGEEGGNRRPYTQGEGDFRKDKDGNERRGGRGGRGRGGYYNKPRGGAKGYYNKDQNEGEGGEQGEGRTFKKEVGTKGEDGPADNGAQAHTEKAPVQQTEQVKAQE